MIQQITTENTGLRKARSQRDEVVFIERSDYWEGYPREGGPMSRPRLPKARFQRDEVVSIERRRLLGGIPKGGGRRDRLDLPPLQLSTTFFGMDFQMPFF